MKPLMLTAVESLADMSREAATARFDEAEKLLLEKHRDLNLANKMDEQIESAERGPVMKRTWWFYPPGMSFGIR